MITNTPATIIVDGVSAVTPFYKRGEGDIGKAEFRVVGENKKPLGAVALTVTGEIVGYFIKPIVLHGTTYYNITGVMTPGDRFVYISVGFEKVDLNALKTNTIYSAYADKDGKFSFSNIHYPDGMISLWAVALAQDATTASLTYELKVSNYVPKDEQLFAHSFSEPKGEYINPLFTIKGTCSEDVEAVYVSRAENATSISELMETMCTSTIPQDGSFTVRATGEYDENYTVWCLGKSSGTFTVDEITVSEDTSTCLSGDTMITMADGTMKRMDSLCADDIVLSECGMPTRIHTTRRGHFSDYHTLYHFEDGTIIDETHPHRFYNVEQGFWQRLQAWNIGDHAINQNGEQIALMSAERIEEKAEMFGIWTDSGTYYANGLLSGAAFCNKKLLEEASVEQAIDMMLSTDEEMLIQLMGLEGVLP